jgi:hypothetical protein
MSPNYYRLLMAKMDKAHREQRERLEYLTKAYKNGHIVYKHGKHLNEKGGDLNAQEIPSSET